MSYELFPTYLEAANSGNTLSSGTTGPVVSISIPPGTWIIDVLVVLTPTGGFTAGSLYQASLSTSSTGTGTLGSTLTQRTALGNNAAAGQDLPLSMCGIVLTVTSTTTYYVTALGTFSGSGNVTGAIAAQLSPS